MRALTALSLVALLALAGCAGPLGSGANPTEAVTPVDPSAVTADPPAGVSADNTVAFGNLTGYQRDAFERAMLDGEAQFIPNTSYVDESEGFREDRMTPFERNEYVRYDGGYYRLTMRQGNLYASYGIVARPAAAGENATVVALADMPDRVRNETREAVLDGQYNAPYGKWDSLPQSLQEPDYVRYENETYDLSFVVGDNWGPVMAATRID